MTDDPTSKRWGHAERMRLLVYIEWYWHNHGVSPSYNSISDFFEIASGSIRHHCGVLDGEGYLSIEHVGIGETKGGRPLRQVQLHVTAQGRLSAAKNRWGVIPSLP